MDEHGLCLSLPVMGDVQLPPPHHLVWYGGVAALVALECIEWPVAVVLATGKMLADNRHSAIAREFGEALEEAGSLPRPEEVAGRGASGGGAPMPHELKRALPGPLRRP